MLTLELNLKLGRILSTPTNWSWGSMKELLKVHFGALLSTLMPVVVHWEGCSMVVQGTSTQRIDKIRPVG